MQNMRKPTHLRQPTKSRRALTLLVACLLGAGTSQCLAAQTVSASVWSSEIDHSLESVIVFQSQSRERTDADIQIYDDILAQQIAQIDVAPPSGTSSIRKRIP